MFYSAFTYLSALLGHIVTKRQQALNELYLFFLGNTCGNVRQIFCSPDIKVCAYTEIGF